MKCIFASVLLMLSTPALADIPLPSTPVGHAANDWLAAVNSGDQPTVEALQAKYHRKTSVPGILQISRLYGGYNILKIESNEPGALVVLLGAKNSDLILRGTFNVDPADPTNHLDVLQQGIPRPPEFAPQRLAQPQALAALTGRADAFAAQDKFSGNILIAKGDKVLLEKNWGLADREARTLVTRDTKFRLGSMNKMFTAVATLQLVAAGKISLDGKLGDYLPDYPNKEMASKVTVRQLLSHTAGAGEIFGPDFIAHRLTLKDNADYVALYGARPPVHEPGAADGYDNYGFILLAAVIEKVSGQSYDDYLSAKIFRPAGMKNTASLPEDQHVPGLAPGYMQQDGKWVSNTETLPYRGTAAGGGYSTLDDLLKFAQALQTGKLLSKSLLAEATSPQNKARWYGFGFMVYPDDKPSYYGHEGGAPGMNADLRIIPDQGVVMVVLSNLDPIVADTLTDFYTLQMPVTP
jgi:D-alanyl-D-alanine carboxypeptidase